MLLYNYKTSYTMFLNDENYTRHFIYSDKFIWGQYMTYYQREKFPYYYVAIQDKLQNVYDENLTRTFYLFIDKFDWVERNP